MKHRIHKLIISVLSLVIAISFASVYNIDIKAVENNVEWNVMDHKFSNYTDWQVSTGGNTTVVNEIVQNEEYISINTVTDMQDGDDKSSRYYFLTSPKSLVFPTEDDIVIEFDAKISGDFKQYERSEIALRAAGDVDSEGRVIKLVLVNGNEEKDSYIQVVGTDGRHDYAMDTSEWNTFRFIISERDENNDRTFKLFVNNTLVFQDINAPKMKGKDLIRMGHDNGFSSSLDIRTMKVKANIQKVTEVKVDENILSTQDRSVNLTVNGLGIYEDYPFSIELVDKNRNLIADFNKIDTHVSISSETVKVDLPNLSEGMYRFKITTSEDILYSSIFNITDINVKPTFPKFEYKDTPIEIDEHKYNSELNPNAKPTEFNFPTIIDTHQTHRPNNGLVDSDGNPFRYYLAYAPHDDPGGISMMMSQSLDGPWTEYDNNPFIEDIWFNEDGTEIYNVPHVSSPDIIWNEDENLFFLFFHGNNRQTRYATSPDLVNWTYGDIAVEAKDFSSIANEASYARVYEHSIDGLDNKYVMLLMVNDRNNVRKIHYAHSKDARNWTAVKEPLADPLNAPDGIDYSSGGFNGPPGNGNMSGANLSGPFLWKWQDRVFLIAHGSNGDIMSIEIGENFNKEVHWGILYNSVANFPDLGRSGAGYFIQDDEERWHMFYEGGSRLENNILHAVESGDFSVNKTSKGKGEVKLSSRTLYENSRLDVEVIADDGYEVGYILINGEDHTSKLTDNGLVVDEVNNDILVDVIFIKKKPRLITNLDEIFIGTTFTLDIENDDQVGSDGWTWDTEYLDASFNSPATFTALKSGETTVLYEDTEGNEVSIIIDIKDKDVDNTPEEGEENSKPEDEEKDNETNEEQEIDEELPVENKPNKPVLPPTGIAAFGSLSIGILGISALRILKRKKQ